MVEDRKERREAYHGRQNANVEMVGTVPWYGDLRQMSLTQGRFLTQRDLEQNAKVCVIENSLEETLFPIHQVLGSSIRLGSQYFEVVGILKPQVNNTKPTKKNETEETEDADTPPRVFIPITTAKRFFG